MSQELASGVGLVPAAMGRSNRISERDQALLEWFFCRGQSVFEQSTFGRILAHQAHFAFETEQCSRCHGEGFSKADLLVTTEKLRRAEHLRTVDFAAYQKRCKEECDVKCHRCEGTGRETTGRVTAPRRFPEDCRSCRGTGEGRRGGECQSCGGFGILGGYTARARAQHEEEASYTPDDVDLVRYAIVSRRLDLLDARSRGAKDILGDYHGRLGLSWAAEDDGGRIFSLYPRTTAGKRWIQRLKNPLDLPGHDLLRTELEIHASTKTPERTKTLSLCRAQATALYVKASGAWVEMMRSMTERHWAIEWDEFAKKIETRRVA